MKTNELLMVEYWRRCGREMDVITFHRADNFRKMYANELRAAQVQQIVNDNIRAGRGVLQLSATGWEYYPTTENNEYWELYTEELDYAKA